jgi:hypothetical protein
MNIVAVVGITPVGLTPSLHDAHNANPWEQPAGAPLIGTVTLFR